MTYLDECRQSWKGGAPATERLYAFTAQTFGARADLRDGPAVFVPPAGWISDVATLSEAAAERLDANDAVRPPGLAIEDDPAIRLRDPRDLDGLAGVTAAIIEQLEERLFRCYLAVDKLHVYRQLPMSRVPASGGSWVWHVDGHPSEVIKALVYLSDVDDDCSAFQLLWSDAKQRALRGESRPLDERTWQPGQSREGYEIADQVVERRPEYRPRRVDGPRGTLAVFSNNCIHRASSGARRYRDTLVLRLRPTRERPAELFPTWVRLEDTQAKLAHAVVDAELRALHERGYVAVRGVVPRQTIAEVARSLPPGRGAELSGAFVDPVEVLPLFECLRARFGARIAGEVLSARVLHKPPHSNGASWHQDGAYWGGERRLTLWVALDEFDETKGCLRLVPGSHTALRAHQPHEGAFGRVAEVAPTEEQITVPVQAGDVVLLDDRVVHGSFANATDEPRLALTFTVRWTAGSS